MDTPATPSQSPGAAPPSRRPALSREIKWLLAIGGGVALVGVGLLVVLILLFWPWRPARTAVAERALASVQLGKDVAQDGLVPANHDHDGATEPSLIGDLECHALQRYPGRPELYAYFRIDPALKAHLTNLVVVEVEYFDADAGGHFRLDYDSHDESNRSFGAYTQSKEKVYLKGTQRWRKARFLLDDARFEGRQNDQSDFRVTVVGARFFLRSVKVIQE
jgi:hypothetical protein